jgi:hypothetical protein
VASTTLRARSVFFCAGVRVAAHLARTPIYTSREWGRRWFNGHYMLHGLPHGALHVLAFVNNGARISQMAIQSPQHK